MAGSVNKVILVGNLGADPEIRHTQDGRAIANLRVATSENWRDKATGERREKTEWHRVVIFNENLCEDCRAVSEEGLQGLSSRARCRRANGRTSSGQERYSTEVVLQGFNGQLTMLDGRQRDGAGEGEARNGRRLRRAPAPFPGKRRRSAARARLRQGARRRDPVLARSAYRRTIYSDFETNESPANLDGGPGSVPLTLSH